MSKKIVVTKEQYDVRKKYLEEKYNAEYINKIIEKKMKKLSIDEKEEEIPEVKKELIEPIKIDTSVNRGKLENRVGVAVEKVNKSVGTRNWSVFRSKEYGEYKKQVPKETASYQQFAKLAGYVWSNLSESEKFDAVENGWGGNWAKVIIK